MFEGIKVGMPQALRYYDGSFQIQIMDGKTMMKKSFLNPSPIEIPAGEVAPLVIFTAKDENGGLWGPDYAWDYDRETWMTYDERFHKMPSVESSPVVEETPIEEPVEELEMPVEEEVEELKTPELPSEEMVDEDDDLLPSEDDDEDDWV